MATVSVLRARSRLPAAAAALSVTLGLLAALAPHAVRAADPLSVSTPYPAVSVAAGSKVSFQLTLKADQQRQVSLGVDGVPSGWNATFRGGGFIVDGVTVQPTGTPPDVRLDVDVPANASGASSMTVTASAGGTTSRLPLTIKVNTTSGGSVAMKADYPALQGTASQTYSFNLTLSNDTAQDLTFSLAAQGPSGWTVTAKPSGQAQAASAVVKAGDSATIDVEANPPSDAAAGDYPIVVAATSGDKTAQQQLGVTITGNYKLTVTTPDQRLNVNGPAGGTITQTIRVQNDGTAPLTGVTFDKTVPSGWNVTFSPSTVDSIAANGSQDVTAQIQPSGDAIAGDYVMTVSAKAKEANGSADFRVTIETSPLWGIVGILLIVAILGGLVWVFRAYGRR
ncbi:MAG TPA: NEW3 domain-containing protein [Candidatus Limnocylindrales bacterium]|nr:NEW3 domain-containing protein [Candidatus Limnocylindrales bacterium]